MSEITILHVNDMHSHFQAITSQTHFMNEERARLEALGQKVWTVDLGDLIDRVHPLVEAQNGKIASPILNQQKMDFVTLGNNEGTAYTPEELEAVYDTRQFTVIISNLKWSQTHEVPPFATEIHMEEIGECKIAFLGLTAAYPESYLPNGYLIENPLKTLERLVPPLAEKGVQIILLSHLGIEMDTQIAEKYPEIQVILGAHTHHFLPEGKWVRHTLLTGGFKYGEYIGELRLRIKGEKLVPVSEKMIAVNSLKENPIVDEGEELRKKGEMLLRKQVVLEGIPAMSIQELAQCSLTAMVRQTGIKVAITYTGLFVTAISSGTLTKYDLHTCMPHPIHLNKTTIPVKVFKELLKQFKNKQPELLEKTIRGYGFRGKIFGEIQMTGFDLKDGKIIVEGRTLKDDDEITFVCPDHLRFSPFFPIIEEKGQNQILYPDLLRTVLEKEIIYRERKHHD